MAWNVARSARDEVQYSICATGAIPLASNPTRQSNQRISRFHPKVHHSLPVPDACTRPQSTCTNTLATDSAYPSSPLLTVVQFAESAWISGLLSLHSWRTT